MSVDITAAGGGLRCIKNRKGGMRAAGDFLDEESIPTSPERVREMLREWPPVGITPDLVPELERHLSEEQLAIVASYSPSVGQAFPSFEFLHINGPVEAGKVAPFLALHTWVPRGIDTFEIWTWVVVEKDAPPEAKVLSRKAAVRSFGSSGNIEQDDGEVWPSQQRSARGAMGQTQSFKYHAFRGHTPPEWWPGPGLVHTGPTGDDGQWGFWERYFDTLIGETD
jgi:hypothetical protein